MIAIANDAPQIAAPGEGLSSAEAESRLRQHGANELPGRRGRNLWKIVREALTEPLLLLLIFATGIYFALGDLTEAILLASLSLLNLGVVVFQDYKTERVLDSLRELASPRAVVVRDGVQRRIASRDVVPGDLLLLSEGDRIAADAVVVFSSDLSVDESLLTGESVPVRKRAGSGERDRRPVPGGEDLDVVFSGTLVVRGQALARVSATGPRTELGRIGRSLAGIVMEETPLRRATRRIARDMAVLGGAVSLLVVALYGLRLGDWIAAILAGVTTAMSLMPEEIPIILTVFLTLGAWRISRRHVLTRRVSAIETLGAATVLCTDKTGTLTVNRMSVARLWTMEGSAAVTEGAPVPPHARTLVETGALACPPRSADPMETAIQRAAAASGVALREDQPLASYGLTPELLAVTHVWPGRGMPDVVAVKGAPETIADLCRLDETKRGALLARVGALASDGFRVLAVARGTQTGALPETPRGFTLEIQGLIGLSDPVRGTVPAAVAECRAAGIRVVMITGDYPETARAIARQAGIDTGHGVVTGAQFAAMDAAALAAAARNTNVFARFRPEQKLILVDQLKASGEIVAMTGDGVNDAPALKAAHIGIAMGGRGTDVAREAATLVLLDDAFESIAAAVRLGRRIFDNLRKAFAYVVAIHIPIAGVALAPLVAGWPIVFSPVHIVFLELIIDPICSIAFEAEPEERNVMRRPPRNPRAPLFGARQILLSALLGGAGLVAILLVYAFALARGMPDAEARAIAFVAVVTVNVILVLANRSRSRSAFVGLFRPNIAMWIVLGTAIVSLVLCVYFPPAADTFGLAPLALPGLALALIPAVALLMVTEAVFWVGRISRPRFDPDQNVFRGTA